MEKKNIYSIRKSKVGAVSTKIVAVAFLALAGGVALNSTEAHAAEEATVSVKEEKTVEKTEVEKNEAKKSSEEKKPETAGKKAEAPADNNKKQEVSEANIQGTGLDREENYDDDVATVAETSVAANERIVIKYNDDTLRGWTQEGTNWYYIKNNGTKATNTWVEGKYYVKSDGKRATNEWIKVGNSWYYTNYDGKYARNEWVDDYYLNNNGTRATSQWKDRGNERYFLKGDGSIAKNTWIQGEYYVKSDGTMSKNEWIKVGNSWYYTNYDGKYARNEWVGDYYLNNNGTRATSQWKDRGSNRYFLKGDGSIAKNTWVQGEYYVKSDGAMAKSEWIKVGNSWYYANYDGRYARNGWVGDYYLNNNGTIATSQWKDRGSNRYFLKGDGSIAKNTWVQGEYYVKSDGAMAKSEWIKVGNSWYYANYDGRYARNGWVGDYYLNNNGTIATSQWKDRGSNRYFLKGDGSIAKNTWVQGEYYVKSDGAMAKSEWVKVGNAWYYADYDGKYARDTWRDGCYLNSNGIRVTGPKEVVTTKTEIETKILEFETEYIEDDTLTKGVEKVVREGVNGSKSYLVEITFVNGVEKKRNIINSNTIPSTSKIVAVGTKVESAKPQTTKEVTVRTETINFTTETRYNSELPEGTTKEIRAGKNGSYRVVRTDTYEGDKLVTKGTERQVDRVEAVNRIVEVGTKKKVEVSDGLPTFTLSDYYMTFARDEEKELVTKLFGKTEGVVTISEIKKAMNDPILKTDKYKKYNLSNFFITTDPTAMRDYINDYAIKNEEKINRQFLKYINEARRKVGRQEAIWAKDFTISGQYPDYFIQEKTNQRAKEMADYGSLRFEGKPEGKHKRPDGRSWYTVYTDEGLVINDNSDFRHGMAGENALQSNEKDFDMVFNPDKFIKDAFEAWMRSPGHRALIEYDVKNPIVTFSYRQGLKDYFDTTPETEDENSFFFGWKPQEKRKPLVAFMQMSNFGNPLNYLVNREEYLEWRAKPENKDKLYATDEYYNYLKSIENRVS